MSDAVSLPRAPVFTIPAEITSEIFLYCRSFASNDEPHPAHAPLLLMHVCREWRQIAMTTPRLWTQLRVVVTRLPPYLRDQEEALKKFLEVWFERAGALPRSFDLDGQFNGQFSGDPHRVHSIVLPSAQTNVSSFTMQMAHGHPRLRPLDAARLVARDPDVYSLVNRSRDSHAAEARLLKWKECTLRRLNAIRMVVSLPWSRLTHFTGASLTADQCLNLLRSASSLVECRVSVDISNTPRNTSTLPAALPRLKLLHVTKSNAAAIMVSEPHISVAKLLALLEVPALQRLQLAKVPNSSARLGLEYPTTTFFSRISASVRRFSFAWHGPVLMDPGIWELDLNWLVSMNQLTHLELVSPSDHFLAPFTQKLEDKTFLPHLHTLRVVDYQSPYFTLGARFMMAVPPLARVAEGRASLQAFDLIWSHKIPWDLSNVAASFKGLVQRGVQVRVGHVEITEDEL